MKQYVYINKATGLFRCYHLGLAFDNYDVSLAKCEKFSNYTFVSDNRYKRIKYNEALSIERKKKLKSIDGEV